VLRSSIRVLTAGIPEGSSQMHPGLAEAVTIILGGLGIVGIIAAAAAVARASSIRQNLELLRGEVADLTASNARLEGENAKMSQELTVLRDLVTSRTDVQELAKEIRTMVRTVHDGYVVLAAVQQGQARPGP